MSDKAGMSKLKYTVGEEFELGQRFRFRFIYLKKKKSSPDKSELLQYTLQDLHWEIKTGNQSHTNSQV